MPLTLTAKKITEVSGAESCCESLTSNTKPSPKPLVENKLRILLHSHEVREKQVEGVSLSEE